MEHLAHFRLSRDPFRNDPERRFYFESAQHCDAERRLVRGIRQGKGLAVLTGPVGSGKTTLVRHLLDHLDERRFEAGLLVLIQGAVDTDWLLQRMALQIGIEEPSPERGQVLGQIYRRLVRLRQRDQHAVILIDEAQMLDRREILVELRGLLNLEFDERRLLSLVLAGLPGLERVLGLDAPLLDRVEIRVELSSFDPRNAHAYLAHRIRCAGGDPAILEEGAARAISHFAGGIPRRMNTLADNALYEAYLAGRHRVEVPDVERAARDLGWGPPEVGPTAGIGEAPTPSTAERGIEERLGVAEVEAEEPAVAIVVPDDHGEPELVVPVAAPATSTGFATGDEGPERRSREPAARDGETRGPGRGQAIPEESEDTEPTLAGGAEGGLDSETTAPEITLTDPVPPEEEGEHGGDAPTADPAARSDDEEGWEGLFSDAPPAPDLPGQVARALGTAPRPDLAAASDAPGAPPSKADPDDDSDVDALFGHLIDKG